MAEDPNNKPAEEEDSSNSGGSVLKPEGIIDAGMKILLQNPDYDTCLHLLVDDLDLESIYPTLEIACNISRETTKFAVKTIDKSQDLVRDVFAHVIDLRDNAVYLGNSYFGLPNYIEMDKLIKERLNII